MVTGASIFGVPAMPQPVMMRASSSAASARRGISALAEEDLGLAVERLRNRLQLRGRFREVDQLDVGAAERGHLAPLTVVSGVDRVQAKPCGEDAVEGRRRASPLDVSEHRRPRLVTRALFDLALQPVGDPAEADVAEGVRWRAVGFGHPALGLRSLGDDDYRRVLAL